MAGENKDTIFFAHSFDEERESTDSLSDLEVAKWFEENLLKRRWRVYSGKRTEARPILEKIAELVDGSDAIVALFTRKYPIDKKKGLYSPSPWVMTECAYAMGRFKYLPHIVAGFREKGVDPSSLAMLSINGMEFPEFDRSNLPSSLKEFQSYLNDLDNRIKHGTSGQPLLPGVSPTYTQVDLQKIFLIYRNGFGTVQNITNMVIRDPNRFMNDYDGKIQHRIWTNRQKFSSLEEMMNVPVHLRKEKAFFNAKLDEHPNRLISPRIEICDIKNTENSITFSIRFVDENGENLIFRKNDTVSYQYAWGLPEMYKIFDDDLDVGDDINNATYNLAEIDANHGKIEKLRIDLRFEREASYVKQIGLFNKSPFYRTSHGFADPLWSQPRNLKPVLRAGVEYDMWYEIFSETLTKFDGRVQIAWRPSSSKS